MYQFLALTSIGVEVLLSDEIKALGAEQVVQKPDGVHFTASLELGYHICLWSRFATRIMLKLAPEVASESKEALYDAAKEINWCEHFTSESTFAVDFVGKSQAIRNTQFGGLTVKDAIVDSFREQSGERPSVVKDYPDIRIQARLLKLKVTFYLDFSGRSLFQRGYRQHSGAAPLKEHLAAALVKRSGWLNDISKPLVDPMCGSGTLLIEAVSMAAKIAPALERFNWGFNSWLFHEEILWQQVLKQAKEASQQGLADLSCKVHGIDIDSRVLKTAEQNVRHAGFGQYIDFKCRDINKLTNVFEQTGTLLFNPPYGERIGELPELVENFVLLGKTLKTQFIDWRIAIFTANVELLTLLKLATSKRYKLKNGPLDCQLALYDISEKQAQSSNENSEFSEKQSDFANRLKKNIKSLKGWLKAENIECYRVYDADIPEFNVAVDVYGEHIVIQEYAAPKNIEEEKTVKRLQEVIYWAPKVLNVTPDKVSLKTRAKQKGKDQYQRLNQSRQALIVHEHGAKLKVNLWDYLDTGLFLDHRKTRQIVAKKSKNKSLLNLFAYTGSVSVQAALHGASSVTTVDMSKTYLEWAQDNFELNNLRGHKYQFVQADCLTWLKRNRDQYDVVFIDPPTFSNSKRMEDSFDVQRDHVALITEALPSVSEQGELIFTNNKRSFKMDFEAMEVLGLQVKDLTEITRDKDFARNKHIHNAWQISRKN
ncbi:MAG: bifunctional 23S rRNA (guanine(2069)-N(7))-methyltransferase RlmK/23S rRNA (guanine(2445)-N(2))-methyltransferase RlmL [Gammaproteobacteria bacterium]|nr:MAG: bifunctional 23S rRNA (guanine(2069)-N(7))-methyltransferase RlmK/23S rRNA (guanine(2445)-N(2))-methyltransferase RlmL [Gammaproteobacteria bacterium]